MKTANSPNWFKAMVEFNWSIRNISGKFGVPRAIAQHIQSTARTCSDAIAIRNASEVLRSQVGF